MVKYKCFECNKKISFDSIGKRIRCPYCGCKMLFKQRSSPTKVKAR